MYLTKRISLIAALMMASGCTHLFFKPTHGIHADPASAEIAYETIKFKSADGTELTGLYFPPEGEAVGTIVHFHGNGQNMTAHYPYSAWLAGSGYNVFIFDYRGYGASGGKPSMDGAVEDGKAALRQALKLPDADPDRMIVFGQSLGGAIAVAAVAESGFKPAAMVLEGTFYSYRGVAAATMRRHWLTWPVSWLPSILVTGKHSPSDNISRITCPKLFLHSGKDSTVPPSQGKKLYEAAPPPKQFIQTPDGHIEAFGTFRLTYAPQLLSFLDQALKK